MSEHHASPLSLEFSLWSADLARLADEIARVDPYADLYHIDVADGHYVRSLLFFPDLVAALRPLTSKPFHVHLMVDEPALWIGEFASAGADRISVHVEHEHLLPGLLQQIHDLGCSPGLAVKLDTPVERIEAYIDQVDSILLLGTALGIKGVGLDPGACPRLELTRGLLERNAAGHVHLLADGGIREETVPRLRAAGATAIVPGSLVFQCQDLADTVQWLRSL
jgi:ribulose-phosphate 3-epimerase